MEDYFCKPRELCNHTELRDRIAAQVEPFVRGQLFAKPIQSPTREAVTLA